MASKWKNISGQDKWFQLVYGLVLLEASVISDYILCEMHFFAFPWKMVVLSQAL